MASVLAGRTVKLVLLSVFSFPAASSTLLANNDTVYCIPSFRLAAVGSTVTSLPEIVAAKATVLAGVAVSKKEIFAAKSPFAMTEPSAALNTSSSNDKVTLLDSATVVAPFAGAKVATGASVSLPAFTASSQVFATRIPSMVMSCAALN